MSKRRTRKEKIASGQKRIERPVKNRKREKILKNDYLQADLTKTLWLTMLALGVEVALYYLLK